LYSSIRWGDVAILLFGLASVAFIAATEFFLGAKEFNLWDIPDGYRKELEEGLVDWEKVWEDSLAQCRRRERNGRKSYNYAIFLMFGGLFFAIGPYDLVVASAVAGLGILLEVFQAFK
jgi:hypothetical protein